MLNLEKILAKIEVPDAVFEKAMEQVVEMRLTLPESTFIAQAAMSLVLAQMFIEQKYEELLENDV